MININSIKIKPADLPATLKVMRLSLGLTQVEIADLCGLAHSAICHYETGQRVPNEMRLNKLLAVYGFKLDAITLRRVA